MLHQYFNALHGILLSDKLANVAHLIWRDRGKFLQELADADPNAHEVTKCFYTNTGTAENRLSILDFGVHVNSVESIHPDCSFTIRNRPGVYKFMDYG